MISAFALVMASIALFVSIFYRTERVVYVVKEVCVEVEEIKADPNGDVLKPRREE